MERLTVLDASQYAGVPGSLLTLETFSATIYAASLAACDLTAVIQANPLEGMPFAGASVDKAALRAARLKVARPEMAEHLADAVHQLGIASTGCRYVASGIARDLNKHRERSPDTTAPEITGSQYAALAALAKEGGLLYVFRTHGTLHARLTGGGRVNISTFKALDRRGLVRVDASAPLAEGRRITVTDDGQRALAHHQPPQATPWPKAANAAAAPAVAGRAGVGR
ncbi:hypothetical protein ACWD4G_31870 [Streptomyces sp. NPDC002643]